jgi:hypothetical protein
VVEIRSDEAQVTDWLREYLGRFVDTRSNRVFPEDHVSFITQYQCEKIACTLLIDPNALNYIRHSSSRDLENDGVALTVSLNFRHFAANNKLHKIAAAILLLESALVDGQERQRELRSCPIEQRAEAMATQLIQLYGGK